MVFMKAVKVQVWEGDRWRSMADSLYYDYRSVKAERGNIYSADGSLLATSIPNFEIRMDLKAPGLKDETFVKYRDTLAFCLSNMRTGQYTPGGYSNLLNKSKEKGNRYALLLKDVTYPELQKIKSFPIFNKGRYAGGLIVERKSQRSKPFKMLLHRSLGYVRENSKPVGLEGSFDEILAGEQGMRLMQRISGSTWIPVNDLTEIEPQNGKDIVTTIDVNIQDVTENALLKAIKKHNAKHGCAIVMEVKTGKIRAIANIGRTEEDDLWETYNYAVGASTQPGSTFKLPAMMALLEDGYVDLEDSIFINKGQMEFAGEMMEDASKHNLEKATVRNIFEMSSNVGIASLIYKHYKEAGRSERFINHLKNFRLHQQTGIEINGEGEPYIKNAFEGDWSQITLPWMSIGYELRQTPLQTLTFYNAVANDGRMMKPYLVTDIQEYGKTIESIGPTVLKRSIARHKTIAKAKELLEGVIETGTADNIKSDSYKIAGKTGTAILNYQRNMADSRKRYQSSFVGYFPADDPVYSCIVLVSTPRQGGFYGGTVAAPVFKEIADKCYATNVEMHDPINGGKKPELIAQQLPNARAGFTMDVTNVLDYLELPKKIKASTNWTYMTTQEDTLAVLNKVIKENIVPDVRGMGLRDAMFLLENEGLKVKSKGLGKVVKQSIKPGTTCKGQTVYLNLY